MITILLALLASTLPAGADPPCSGDGWRDVIHETFASGSLDADVWLVTEAHDFRTRSVEVVPPAAEESGGRLRLHADTIGTDDATVKHLGVGLRRPIDLSQPHEIAFEIDWNDQANGSYLAAGVYLSPAWTPGAVAQEADWIKMEYIGVPPGSTGRHLLALRTGGRLRILDDDGWPADRPQGRALGRMRVRIVIDGGTLRVRENGALVHDSGGAVVPFPKVHLYLQMSSHSNYPGREVFFRDIRVRRRCTTGRGGP